MKKITVWLATLVMCFGLVAATPQQADARRWHGGWGIGLAAGLIGAGLLYGAHRHYYGGYYGYGYRRPYYASYYSPSYAYYRPYRYRAAYYRPYRYRAFYGYPRRYYRRHWRGRW